MNNLHKFKLMDEVHCMHCISSSRGLIFTSNFIASSLCYSHPGQNTLFQPFSVHTHTHYSRPPRAIFTQAVQTDEQLFLLASCITHNSFPIGKLINITHCGPEQTSENTKRTSLIHRLFKYAKQSSPVKRVVKSKSIYTKLISYPIC